MNRRGFLQGLFGGLVAAVVSTKIPLALGALTEKIHPMLPDTGIGGWVKYRFHYTVTLPPSTSHLRLRYIDSLPAIRWKVGMMLSEIRLRVQQHVAKTGKHPKQIILTQDEVKKLSSEIGYDYDNNHELLWNDTKIKIKVV